MGKAIVCGGGRATAPEIALPPTGTILNDCTWQEISAISRKGLGANYFAVGDAKEIEVAGRIGTQTVDAMYFVYIIGFNHNSAVEGNGITFGTFKTAITGGRDFALIDSSYGTNSTTDAKAFNMNHSANTNAGGWKGCDMRYDILGSTHAKNADADKTTATNPVSNTMMSALPADLRAVMKPMTIYSDNVGGSNTASNVTTSVDYLPLLAEFEIFGTRQYSNSEERLHQAQYAYFVSGNSKVKYRHNGITQAADWWQRSIYYGAVSFCRVHSSGEASTNGSSYACGVAPIFRV